MTHAKTRKRCPWCSKMVEVGTVCNVVDGRRMVGAIQWFGREYERGAVHLYHAGCREAELARCAELETQRDARLEEMRLAFEPAV